jgi:hypothetical protein
MEFSKQERIDIVASELKQAIAGFLNCDVTEAEHQEAGERLDRAHALKDSQPVDIRTAIQKKLTQ